LISLKDNEPVLLDCTRDTLLKEIKFTLLTCGSDMAASIPLNLKSILFLSIKEPSGAAN